MANPTILQYTNAKDGINASTFVAIAFPVSCNGYLLKNVGPDTLYMRSDPNDANTEDSIPAGAYEDLLMTATLGNAASNYPCSTATRFSPGAVLYWVKCTGPLVGKFWI